MSDGGRVNDALGNDALSNDGLGGDASSSDAATDAAALAGAGSLGVPQPASASDADRLAESNAEEATAPGTAAAADASAAAATTGATSSAAMMDASGSPMAAAVATASVPARRRAATLVAILRRLLRFAFAAALLSLGIYAGYRVFLDNQPVPPVVADPSVGGVATPAVVVELVNAMTANDSDRIRTAMPQQVFDSYAAELQKYGISTIDEVETLGTYVDGSRTSTMLVIHARRVDSNPFTLFLVVQMDNGTIVRLR